MSYLLGYNPGTQQWGYPRRGGAQLSGTIIVHTAECAADNVGEDTSAEGCARIIANRADYGSYHRLVDSDSIIDMLPWEYEAWQDSETNNWAVGISAALRTSDWAVMPADRRDRVYRNLAACAADFVRYMAGKGIQVPLRRISGAEARARVPGFCAHGDSGIARSDPGANFDWALFFAYTQAALDGSLSYASESITPLEDELSAGDVAAIIDAVQKMHDVTRDHIPGAVLNKQVPHKDPITGLDDGQTTSLATMAGFFDFQAVQTRLASQSPAVIAAEIDAAGLAAQVRDELVKLLAGK
jgi:hypothetical protein